MLTETDRRVRRTNRTLSAALIKLASERPYSSIQVRDITDQADVGYATFYRHYDSKDDLMLAVFDEIAGELESSIVHHGAEYFQQEGSLLFGHVQTYQGLYRSILQSPEFVRKFKLLLSRRIEEHFAHHMATLTKPAFPPELAAHHMVAALVGLIEWWLETDLKLPLEQMSLIYKRLIIQATWFALDARNNLDELGHI